MKVVKKPVKQFSLEEKAKAMQEELNIAAQKEEKEVIEYVSKYLESKGYAISARMILEAGKAPTVQPFIFKVQK